jgi:type I restriction enzyme, S subunit
MVLSMCEWKEIKLGDILNLITKGTTPPKGVGFVDKGINYVKSDAIGYDRKLDKSKIVHINEETHQKFKRSQLAENDILFSMAGIYLGKNAIVPKDILPANTNQALAILRLNQEKANPNYVSLYLSQHSMIDYVNNMSGQSAQPNVNFEEIKSIEINLPPLPEQKAIASILSSLDDKIDLLHRQNKTLESMAETLFRQWFVEEAKEDWVEKPLGSLVTVKRGGSPRPIQDYLSDSGLRWLKISDATKENSPYIFEIKEHIKVEGLNKTTHLKAGTLVLSNSATPGIPKILQVDTCIHDGWLHFPKSHFSNEFLYLLFKKIRPELIQQGNGSIFTNLKTDILKEYPIPIADNESLLFFDNQVKPIFNKILKNQIQIRTLTALRDTLLPKLMSGEIKVKY